MATFLFDDIIFGPVNSRRLGVSLGINLLPVNVKVCSFDCIYCECGFTPDKYADKGIMPSREEVCQNLEKKLLEMAKEGRLPDVITFAGNGEPTLHRSFAGIIDDTIDLRNQLAPEARIAVLSNATMLHRKEVFDALLRVDDNIQKLDSAFSETIELIDCPRVNFDLDKVVDQLTRFKGRVIIQTLFLKGIYKGVRVNNTTDNETDAWLELLKQINPQQVMMYTIARDTPVESLQKIPAVVLDNIAAKVEKSGIKVQVSY